MSFAFWNNPTSAAVTKQVFTNYGFSSSTMWYFRNKSSTNDGTSWTTNYTSPSPVSSPEYYFTSVVAKPGTNTLISWANQTTNYIKKSTDGGVTWSNKSIPASLDTIQIIYVTGSTFFAMVQNGAHYISTDDGDNWSATATTTSNSIWRGVCYNPTSGTILMIGYSLSGTVRRALSTDLAVSWSTGTTPAVGPGQVIWDPINALYLTVADSGTNKIYSSANGTSWTARSTTANVYSIATDGAGNSVAFNDQTGTAYYSSNGTSWSAGTAISVTAGDNFSSVAWTGTNFLIIKRTGTIGANLYSYTSSNGNTWSSASTVDTVSNPDAFQTPKFLGVN